MFSGGDADRSSALELLCMVSAGIFGASRITLSDALFISRSVRKFVLPPWLRSCFVFTADALPELGYVSEKRGLLFLASVCLFKAWLGSFVAEPGSD